MDNTNWRAGRAGGPSGRLQKRAGRAAEKGSPPTRPFPQASLMCSPLACPVVQPASPPFSVQLASPRKIMFFIWQHGPLALRLVLSVPLLFLSLYLVQQFNTTPTSCLHNLAFATLGCFHQSQYEYDLVKVLNCQHHKLTLIMVPSSQTLPIFYLLTWIV